MKGGMEEVLERRNRAERREEWMRLHGWREEGSEEDGKNGG